MKIRIISLGEIVTPHLNKGIEALAKSIDEKNGCGLEQAANQVGAVITKVFTDIEKFKQGVLPEDTFNEIFITTLESVSGVRLSVDEFDAGWDAMNPRYAAFSKALKEAIAFNNKKNQKLEFISYTNPKDMRHLAKELQKNNVDFMLDDNGNLCEISGIKLHTTFANKLNEQSTKANIIKNTIITLKQSTAPRNLLFSEQKNDLEQDDIKYIHGVNEIQFEKLRNDFDNTTLAVEEIAGKFRVDSILWKKNSLSLTEILNEENPAHVMIFTSAL